MLAAMGVYLAIAKAEAIGLALANLRGAIAGIFKSFAQIPLGIGIPLAIGAVAGLVSMFGKAKKAGDMLSPADGKTQVSTKEGDLFELSPNDDFIAAPGIASPVESKTPQTLGQQPTSMPNISMDGVIKELRELKAAFLANKDVYIDNERMTSKISRTQEKMITNQFGLMGT